MNQSSRRKYATTFTEDEEAAFRSRRKRITARTYWQSAFILIIIVTLSYLDRHGYFLAPQNDFDYYQNKTAIVVRVIDGDTLDINIPDRLHHTQTTRIRLWGVNCPETAKPPGFHDRRQATPAEPFANEATEFTNNKSWGNKSFSTWKKPAFADTTAGSSHTSSSQMIIQSTIHNRRKQSRCPSPIPIKQPSPRNFSKQVSPALTTAGRTP